MFGLIARHGPDIPLNGEGTRSYKKEGAPAWGAF